jgi:hypothetical protein
MKLPTFEMISPTLGLDLDERCAVDHFLGLTLADATEILRFNLDYHLDDLSHMGLEAFEFYFKAFENLLLTEDDFWTESVVYSLCCTVECRIRKGDRTNNLRVESNVRVALEFCLKNLVRFSDFGIENPKLMRRIQRILQSLNE